MIMNGIKKVINSFSRGEKILWLSSVTLIIAAFLIFDRGNYLALAASLLGTTSLIFNAKGNPFGQVLIIIFSLIYAYISYTYAYYGEMITYVGMTAPMAAISLVTWLRNPFKGNRSEVKVNKLSGKEIAFAAVLSVVVTVIFYFILKKFNTANLVISTASVITSFFAAYLTFRRSAFFALAFMLNDVVLIVLWSLAAAEDPTYVSVIICFVAFLANDLYSFINWSRLQKKQAEK